MTNRRDFLRLTGGALAGVSLAPGLIGEALAQAAKKGGSLSISLVPEPSGILQLSNNPSLVVALNISDGLVTYDKDSSSERSSAARSPSRRCSAGPASANWRCRRSPPATTTSSSASSSSARSSSSSSIS